MNDCIFCNKENDIILESELSFAIYDRFPVNKGHMLVIPSRHEADYFHLSDNEKKDLWKLVDEVKEHIQSKFHPDAFNVGFNVNHEAGQTIFHAHIHVIPRYRGDVVDPTGGVRNVIPGKGNYKDITDEDLDLLKENKGKFRNIDDLLFWEAKYNTSKYPYSIYYELVVQAKSHNRKMELMGAWKSGCMRRNLDIVQYTDDQNNSFGFNKRWSNSAPVGKMHWQEISDTSEMIQKEIPEKFPLVEPSIVKTLSSKSGFGFVWAVFVLHCYHPEIYPIFDQHVFRAYRFIETSGSDNPKYVKNNWSSYSAYRNFFSTMQNNYKIEFWRLDKALWTYGKFLKKKV